MKNLFILALLVFSFNIYGQTCQDFVYFKNNSEIEITHYDKKGKLSSKSNTKVLNINTSATGTDAKVKTTMFDEKGKKLIESDLDVRCANNIISMSLKNLMPQDQLSSMKDMEVKIDETFLDYPTDMSDNTILKNGNFKAEVYSGTMKIMTMKFDISDRKILGKESITTSAGTFDCFKISYTSKFSAIFNFTMDVVEWYSPKVGLVKSETMKGGKPVGTSVLTMVK